MASIFNPGTGSLKSTTLPNAFFEMAVLLSTAEKAATTPPENIEVNISLETNRISIEATLPITTGLDAATGMVTVDAVDYLTPAGVVAPYDDAGSDLFGNERPSAFWQLAQKLHAAEKALTTPAENIEISANFENGAATISATLPATVLVSNSGAITIEATDYL